jgi:hypothetical protein
VKKRRTIVKRNDRFGRRRRKLGWGWGDRSRRADFSFPPRAHTVSRARGTWRQTRRIRLAFPSRSPRPRKTELDIPISLSLCSSASLLLPRRRNAHSRSINAAAVRLSHSERKNRWIFRKIEENQSRLDFPDFPKTRRTRLELRRAPVEERRLRFGPAHSLALALARRNRLLRHI